jgi:hypothetical protein
VKRPTPRPAEWPTRQQLLALAEVSTAEDADDLWRKVRAVEEAARLARVADATVAAMTRVRLRAKRRWGELLGPPAEQPRDEKGRVTGGHTGPAQAVGASMTEINFKPSLPAALAGGGTALRGAPCSQGRRP